MMLGHEVKGLDDFGTVLDYLIDMYLFCIRVVLPCYYVNIYFLIFISKKKKPCDSICIYSYTLL